MTAPADPAAGALEAVWVEAPARLHLGVLDLRGSLGRSFGGIGAAAPAPTLLLSATAAERGVEASGEDAGRAAGYARRLLAHHGVSAGARIRVHRALPAHAGLGSGTQLALATARAVAELYALPTDAPTLAHAVGRAQRSAIGTWLFDGGGLVLEGGRRPGTDRPAPLLARLAVPPHWRCVVALPDAAPGISGAAETTAFAELPPPAEREVERVAHLVLMALLPAVVEDDVATFGAALTEIQRVTGGWFAPVQGEAFVPGPGAELLRRMPGWGAAGVGQSSWGPTVYGVAGDPEAGAALAARVRESLGSRGRVYDGPFGAHGARVWRAAADGSERTPPR